jgi:hypothetical protein
MELEQVPGAVSSPTSFASRECRFAPAPTLCPAGERAVRSDRRADGLILWLSGQLNRATSALLERELHLARARRPRWREVVLTAIELIERGAGDDHRRPGIESGVFTPLPQAQPRAHQNGHQLAFQAPRVVRHLLELVAGDQASWSSNRAPAVKSTSTLARAMPARTSITCAHK